MNRWKNGDFRGAYVYKAKHLSKKAMTLIFFSSESWDVAFYKSDKKGTPKGTPDEIFYYENMKKVDFFQNILIISNQNSYSGVPLDVPFLSVL